MELHGDVPAERHRELVADLAADSQILRIPKMMSIQGTSGPRRVGKVEDGRGGCTPRSPLRFPSPLIKSDVLISSIRLFDRRHRTAPMALDLPDRSVPHGSRSS